MGKFQQVNQSELEKFLLHSEKPVIIDFSAGWCGPCQRMKPVLNRLADKWDGKAYFFEVDADECYELAMKYQVMSVPTLLLLVNRSLKSRLSGLQPEAKIVNEFEPWLRD